MCQVSRNISSCCNIKITLVNVRCENRLYSSKEAESLANSGVQIIITIGHSGYDMGQQVAANCPLVDVVVGGHTHTFLYNGEQPDIDPVEGPYPTIVTQKSGKKVPVVQTLSYTKYLGILKLIVSHEFC